MAINEYQDCLKGIRELARAIRSNGLSAAERNEIAGNLTIIATKLDRLSPHEECRNAINNPMLGMR